MWEDGPDRAKERELNEQMQCAAIFSRDILTMSSSGFLSFAAARLMSGRALLGAEARYNQLRQQIMDSHGVFQTHRTNGHRCRLPTRLGRPGWWPISAGLRSRH